MTENYTIDETAKLARLVGEIKQSRGFYFGVLPTNFGTREDAIHILDIIRYFREHVKPRGFQDFLVPDNDLTELEKECRKISDLSQKIGEIGLTAWIEVSVPKRERLSDILEREYERISSSYGSKLQND